MRIIDRSRLRELRKASVSLGTAPDGLPWVLNIDRGTPPDHLLQPIARALGVEAKAPEWQGPLRALADEARELVERRQFCDLEDGGPLYYISWSNAGHLCHRTLLERLVDERSGSPETNDPYNTGSYPIPSGTSRTAHSRVDTRMVDLNAYYEEQLVRQEAFSGVKLALDLTSESVVLVRLSTHALERPSHQRDFVEETFSGLESARFRAAHGLEIRAEGAFGRDYHEAHQHLMSEFCEWTAVVRRQEVLALTAGLARRLEKALHAEERIHGDLKPSNTLITPEGLVAIDSLDIPVSAPSPGLSQGYAAPEQVLGEAVRPQTDQYGLGVCLAQVCGGLLYGEESNFRIPVGPRQLETFTMLKNPGVYLPPQSINAPKEAINTLRALIERCLRFDPDQRFPSMEALAETIEDLLERFEFTSTLVCDLSFGQLMHEPDDGMFWSLRDQHP